eukprot:scaffold22560_cov135-Cylindrotheca_fusiformis.AAC.39
MGETGSASPVDQVVVAGLSKSRQKKLCKLERKRQAKAERKAIDREARIFKAKAAGRDLHAEEQFRMERTLAGDSKRRRQIAWETEKLPILQSNFEICLDCSFEEFMTDREIASLASQIRYCYSYNKRAKYPSKFTVTSLTGRTLELLQKETGFHEWPNRGFVRTETDFIQHFDQQALTINKSDQVAQKNLVYLTSDSENTLLQLDVDKTYVIGGIVDRNRHKGLCYKKAKKFNICHAKLPLDACLAQAQSKVMTCNHVFGILLKYREYDRDWTKAFEDVLPGRKAAKST